MFLWPFQHEPAVVGSSSAGALGNGEHSDRAGCPICSPQYPNLRRARSRPVPMGLCDVSRWCEGCRNKSKAQLSWALERIQNGLRWFCKPCPALKQTGGQPTKYENLPYISIGWRRECQSTPIER